MPYVLVEAWVSPGYKELVATPDTWIQWRNENTPYLRWPNHRNMQKLNALLADERSVPEAAWDKQRCEVIRRNIPSLEAALRMMEMIEDRLTPPAPEVVAVSVPARETVKPGFRTENLDELLSYMDCEHVEDPLAEDAKPLPQLLDLMVEIRSLIKSNQEEVKKQLHEGFYRMQRAIFSLIGKSSVSNISHEQPPADKTVTISVDLLTCKEELENFEERLKDTQYRKEVHEWVDYTVGYEVNAMHRMHRMLDFIFDRKFFATFSWKGGGVDKSPMNIYENVLNLFEHIGTTPMHRANRDYVAAFFKNKLRHANSRINITGSRKSVPHTGLKRLKKCIPMQYDSDADTVKRVKKAQNTCTDSDGKSESSNKRFSYNSEQDPSPTCTDATKNLHSEGPIKVNIIRSVEALDMFEKQLRDDKKLKQMYNWIDNTVRRVADREQCMMKLLDLLVDKSVLRNFTWTGVGNTKRALMNYTKFIRLFEYATRTVVHQTIVLNHAQVAEFFTKYLNNIE